MLVIGVSFDHTWVDTNEVTQGGASGEPQDGAGHQKEWASTCLEVAHLEGTEAPNPVLRISSIWGPRVVPFLLNRYVRRVLP